MKCQLYGDITQKDARIKNTKLAKDLGIAPSTMAERIKRLEDQGYFKGFRAIVDPAKLGYTVQALISISLGEHTIDDIGAFEQQVATIPEIRTCFHVTGRFDYFLLAVAMDLSHLGELIKRKIAALPGAGKIETFIVYSETKRDGVLPFGDDR